MNDSKIKVLLVEPEKYPKEIVIDDSLEAMQEYGIMRLASRVSALKKSGLPVRTELVRGENRFGEPTCYARYSLDESEVVRDG